MIGFRWTAFVVLMCTSGILLAEQPVPAPMATYTAAKLVDGYERALKPFEHVTYATEGHSLIKVNDLPRIHAEYGAKEDENGRGVYRHLYRRDGNRLDILSLK